MSDHHTVMMAAPAVIAMFAVFAEVAMFAKLGARAEAMMVALPDHHFLSACN